MVTIRPIHKFNVQIKLPPRLEKLKDLVYNLKWSWDYEIIDLFRRIDRKLWEKTYHNPVALLSAIPYHKLEELVEDYGFISHFDKVCENFEKYMTTTKFWFNQEKPIEGNWNIAYFSMEFGITECLPIYSGGLGILSGDHIKSASDLGLPIIGIGLCYQKGYLKQFLTPDGMQQELQPTNDFYKLPIELIRNDQGLPIKIYIEFPKRNVCAQIWKLQVGRASVLLLDTNVPENTPEDQGITHQLYGGNEENRIKQEMILGIGGIRALKILGFNPLAYHMNEGHSAFLAIERIIVAMQEKQLNFKEACEYVKAGNIFTTHTPVPAGIDRFSPDLVETYLKTYREKLGLSEQEFLALGRENPNEKKEFFCMAILALRLSNYKNGVSILHGEVSRKMWQNIWPQIPEKEIPIGSITNGVHYRSWISSEMARLYDRYLGPKWSEDPKDTSVWEAVENIPSEELWNTHERLRQKLISFTRSRLKTQLQRRGASPNEIDAVDKILDIRALTIGFARRFATYKRAYLLLHDIERLIKILNDPQKPVQIIFAGKAHPRDNEGKDLIKKIITATQDSRLRYRIVFIEDYDMNVARYLVQGCDIWLNTPRRLEEASGTSGMKAALNGALNMSILDGWWDEAYHPGIGWAIGSRQRYADQGYQDYIDGTHIYKILEEDAIPLFFDRSQDNIPRKWVQCMKDTIRELCPAFNTNRMVTEYAKKYYFPAIEKTNEFELNNLETPKELAKWKNKLITNWDNIKILDLHFDSEQKEISIGNIIKIYAKIALNELTEQDISVETYIGNLDSNFNIIEPEILPMKFINKENENIYSYYTEYQCSKNGQYGFTIRIRPNHQQLVHPFELPLIKWYQPKIDSTTQTKTNIQETKHT